jgi:hypothetical protein
VVLTDVSDEEPYVVDPPMVETERAGEDATVSVTLVLEEASDEAVEVLETESVADEMEQSGAPEEGWEAATIEAAEVVGRTAEEVLGPAVVQEEGLTHEPESGATDFDEGPMEAEAPDFLRGKSGEVTLEELPEEPFTPQTQHQDDGEAEELPQVSAEDAEGDFEANTAIAETSADEREPVPAFGLTDEAQAVGSNGAYADEAAVDEPPDTIPGEAGLSPEMAAFLKSRRRDQKERPFDRFNSPPGRF